LLRRGDGTWGARKKKKEKMVLTEEKKGGTQTILGAEDTEQK